MSPALTSKVVYAGVNHPSFEQGSKDLAELMDLAIDAKQVERVAHRIGRERCDERDADVARYLSLPLVERKDKPEGVVAPEVAVVGADGGRLQIRDDSWLSAEKKEEPAAPVAVEEAKKAEEPATPVVVEEKKKADEPAAPVKVEGEVYDDDKDEDNASTDKDHGGKYWREDKIGLLMTMTSAEKESDPCPEIPEAFVDPTRIVKLARELKTKKSASTEESAPEVAAETETPEEAELVLREEGQKVEWQPPEVETKQLSATRQKWKVFGPLLATMAWSMGFFQSPRRAFLGDGSKNNWTMWRNHFSSFVPILDFIHALSYVYAAATAGQPFAEGWARYVRWITLVWQGTVEQVIAEMAQRLAELGAPHASDGDTHPRVIVRTALNYLRTNKQRMKYAEYRRQGLPITSAYVESAVKQFNQRVKGTEKFWTEAGAEALLQLRADYLGTTNPLTEFWQSRQDSATGQPSRAQAV